MQCHSSSPLFLSLAFLLFLILLPLHFTPKPLHHFFTSSLSHHYSQFSVKPSPHPSVHCSLLSHPTSTTPSSVSPFHCNSHQLPHPRFDGQVKHYRLYYDGQKHYVGEKRFDTLHSLVADGLVCLFIELRAGDQLRAMQVASYTDSPYYTLTRASCTPKQPPLGKEVGQYILYFFLFTCYCICFDVCSLKPCQEVGLVEEPALLIYIHFVLASSFIITVRFDFLYFYNWFLVFFCDKVIYICWICCYLICSCTTFFSVWQDLSNQTF